MPGYSQAICLMAWLLIPWPLASAIHYVFHVEGFQLAAPLSVGKWQNMEICLNFLKTYQHVKGKRDSISPVFNIQFHPLCCISISCWILTPINAKNCRYVQWTHGFSYHIWKPDILILCSLNYNYVISFEFKWYLLRLWWIHIFILSFIKYISNYRFGFNNKQGVYSCEHLDQKMVCNLYSMGWIRKQFKDRRCNVIIEAIRSCWPILIR